MGADARNPIAVVSGGSSGIGLEICRLLRQRGYCLHLLARDPTRLERAQQELLSEGQGDIAIHPLDVTDAPACAATIGAILACHGRIDWLVTSAGIVEPGLFLNQSPEASHRQMAVNYFGTLNLVRPVAEHMVAAGGGRIILVSSAAAFTGIAGYGGYCPSKAAIQALGEVLYTELAPHGVGVSVAFPPDTDTPQLAAETLIKPEATRRITAGGGVLSAQVVARAIVEKAEAGKRVLAPSALMTLFAWFHSLYAPFFLRRQIRIITEVNRERDGS